MDLEYGLDDEFWLRSMTTGHRILLDDLCFRCNCHDYRSYSYIEPEWASLRGLKTKIKLLILPLNDQGTVSGRIFAGNLVKDMDEDGTGDRGLLAV